MRISTRLRECCKFLSEEVCLNQLYSAGLPGKYKKLVARITLAKIAFLCSKKKTRLLFDQINCYSVVLVK